MYQANLMKKITTDHESEIQAGLDALAKTQEFIQVLQEEVTASGLQLEAVTDCIPNIYHEASKRALSNDFVITIYKDEHTMEECAVLAAFLKMQHGWPHPLKWREQARRGREINY